MTSTAGAGPRPREDELRVTSHETSETAAAGRFIPGQRDMWVFVLFESIVFTSYFTVYMIRRTQSPELFLQSQAELSLAVGVFNTLVLLASSWSLARCVQAARERSFASASTNALLTMFFALVFLVSKVREWAAEIGNGYGFTASEFFSFYYFLTAIHFIHLLIGLIALGIVVHQLWSPARRSQETIETCATYWHTVDYLWVVIFALLYVMR
jgi:nitric oxide reductase NorE protein